LDVARSALTCHKAESLGDISHFTIERKRIWDGGSDFSRNPIKQNKLRASDSTKIVELGRREECLKAIPSIFEGVLDPHASGVVN
jgi:hypothetical protein